MNADFHNSNAILLTDGILHKPYAKTAHGLIRYSARFTIKAILDSKHSDRDAGEILDGKHCDIPVVGSLEKIIKKFSIEWAIVGIAPVGGKMTPTLKNDIINCLEKGISVISGLHDYLGSCQDIVKASKSFETQILDIRKPKPGHQLHGFTGEISKLTLPRIAVMGTDCALGKRTTARIITQAACNQGINTELIYTGQTGWLQDGRYGFILDSTLNDFVAGELEYQILLCAKNERPDLILIEGQSSLRNPYGPCGAEFIVSGGAKGVILQHDPPREYHDGLEKLKMKIGRIQDEIQIIELLGAKVIAISLNSSDMDKSDLMGNKNKLEKELAIPVLSPLHDSEIELLVPVMQFIKDCS